MQAARTAGAIAVGVANEATPPAGADVALANLSLFPAWLEEHLARTGMSGP
jgi:hypothetical protein